MIRYFDKGDEDGFLRTWVDMEGVEPTPGMEGRCTKAFLQSSLNGIPGAKVVSVDIEKSGVFQGVVPSWAVGMESCAVYTGLPKFCRVVVSHEQGSTTEKISVWVPFAWNGRFLGTAGAGNHCGFVFGFADMECSRTVDPAVAVKNGYATATTNGGVDEIDYMLCDWGVAEEGGELDADCFENWVHRSTHSMTVIGKAVTEALQGRKIEYSYLQGCSGGGRQVLMEAVYHPDDYDGIWSDAPAIYWTRNVAVELWPAVVMNCKGVYLGPAKLNAFRDVAIAEVGGPEAFYSYGNVMRTEFDASRAVGIETAEGAITQADAEVMQMICDGPRDFDGTRLWWGLRSGEESWGEVSPDAICMLDERPDGTPDVITFPISVTYFGLWLQRKLGWDWHELSIEEFVNLFKKGMQEQAFIACDNPDLAAFRADSGKLLLTQGIDDEVILPDAAFDYYKQVAKCVGGKESLEDFMRFYPIPGDGHGSFAKNGAGPSLATCMLALSRWVEEGVAPGNLKGQHFDFETGKVDRRAAVPFLSIDPDSIPDPADWR